MSYLIVVGFAWSALGRKIRGSPAPEAILGVVQTLSLASVSGGLIVLAGLIGTNACIPNARPLFDYSAYVNVC